MITQEFLKSIFQYDKDTGHFIRINGSNHTKKNVVLGSKNNHGYINICINGKMRSAHRLAFIYMNGNIGDGLQVDHIDHNRSNNAFSNLRLVSRKQNMKNQRKRSTNTTGHTGVLWNKQNQKWQVMVWNGVKNIHYGLFVNKEDAIQKRNEVYNAHGYHTNHISDK